jgi:hypothetical protein
MTNFLSVLKSFEKRSLKGAATAAQYAVSGELVLQNHMHHVAPQRVKLLTNFLSPQRKIVDKFCRPEA